MNKIVNATEHKEILKQLALAFISDNGNGNYQRLETVRFSGAVSVYGDAKFDRRDDYYIYINAELPKKCKFHNEITVFANCHAVNDGEDVFECKIEDIGLTQKQLESFIRSVNVWSLDYIRSKI